MEFHGNQCPNTPWNSMENFPSNSMELHGIPWRYFTRDVSVPLLIHILTFGIVLSSCLLVLFKNNHGTGSIGWFSNVFLKLNNLEVRSSSLTKRRMEFDIHLALKLSQWQTRFFILHVCQFYDQFFLGQIPVLCTAQINKNSQDPQRSAFNFSKTSLILTLSTIKQNACLLKGPLKYLVAMIRGCHARAILLPVVRKFFARFLASRCQPVAGSSRR